jgi:hypothetical protein
MLLGRPRVPVVQWLGHRPFTAVTRVRIPSGTPIESKLTEIDLVRPVLGNAWVTYFLALGN